MKASLDTNVIIHFYRAGLESDLFQLFQDGIIIYQQILDVELKHHGSDIIGLVEADIEQGRILIYSDEQLRRDGVYRLFRGRVEENRLLYQPGDMGEVYAISLAETLGAYSLVTDDIKQGGPYMSLIQMDDYDLLPFHFADVLILRYLLGFAGAEQTVSEFNRINEMSGLNWSFRSQMKKFIRRFWRDPYKNEEQEWMEKLVRDHNIHVKDKFINLMTALKSTEE